MSAEHPAARRRPEPSLPKPDYAEHGWPISGLTFMLPVLAFASVCLVLVLR